MGGIVVAAECQVQVGKLAGGAVIDRMLGLCLGSSVHGGANNGFHVLGDQVSHVLALLNHGLSLGGLHHGSCSGSICWQEDDFPVRIGPLSMVLW